MTMQFLLVLLCTTAYAVLRYVVFGDVSPAHIPAYILNKSISMAAAAGLFMVSAGHLRARREAVHFWGRASLHLVTIHILLSLPLLSRGYYPKFFDGDRMNLTGEGMLLSGALAFYCFWRLGIAEPERDVRRNLAILSRVLTGCHLFIMGAGGWMHVEKWHGGLPPITLLSFLLVTYSLVSVLRMPAADFRASAGSREA